MSVLIKNLPIADAIVREIGLCTKMRQNHRHIARLILIMEIDRDHDCIAEAWRAAMPTMDYPYKEEVLRAIEQKKQRAQDLFSYLHQA